MIQRTLFRHSKALTPCIRSASRTSLARPQFLPRTVVAPVSTPMDASRWYATEPEAKKEDASAGTREGTSKESEGEAGDPLQKELEIKEKEIIDLKVCRLSLRIIFSSSIRSADSYF